MGSTAKTMTLGQYIIRVLALIIMGILIDFPELKVTGLALITGGQLFSILVFAFMFNHWIIQGK